MKVEVLFPEICNLFGDLSNIVYLERCAEDVEIIQTALGEVPRFIKSNDVDLIYLASMTEKAQVMSIAALLPYREKILSSIESNQVFLVTGNALEIFGSQIESAEMANPIKALNIFPLTARRDLLKVRYNSLYVGEFEDSIKIVGFKSLFGFSYGNVPPLFNTIRGCGINKSTKAEGIRVNNFMATYVTGPLLPLNPLFTKHICNLCGNHGKIQYEKEAMDAYNSRLKDFLEPDRGLEF